MSCKLFFIHFYKGLSTLQVTMSVSSKQSATNTIEIPHCSEVKSVYVESPLLKSEMDSFQDAQLNELSPRPWQYDVAQPICSTDAVACAMMELELEQNI